VTLVFNEGDLRFFGSTGCNRYSGNFKLDQDSLLMAGVVSTRRACVPALMNQEKKFLAILPVIQKDDINANGLLILRGSDNKEQLRFIAMLNE
jgi:putative lipoprotein